MKEDDSSIWSVIKAIVERHSLNGTVKIVAAIGVFIIMPMEGFQKYYLNFSLPFLLFFFFVWAWVNIIFDIISKKLEEA